MGVLSRFNEIMKANINDFLDKFQNDEKMLNQKLRELRESYAEVKESAVKVMAEESSRKAALDEAQNKVGEYNLKAEKAVRAGNDDDARVLLEEVERLEAAIPGLQQNYDMAHTKAIQVRRMSDKLLKDIQACEDESAGIKSDMAMANATNKLADAMDKAKATKASESIAEIKERTQRKLYEANARAELNSTPVDKAAEVAAKYGGTSGSSNVEERLAVLKAKIATPVL